MAYRVDITRTAERNLEQAAAWYYEVSPAIAARWKKELINHIQSLSENPLRCPVDEGESQNAGRKLRKLMHGKKRGQYRILFEVRGKVVYVLSIRHSFRKGRIAACPTPKI